MIENDMNWNVNIKKCLPNWIYKVRGVHRNFFRGGESNHRQDIEDLLNEFEALRPVLWLPLNSIHLICFLYTLMLCLVSQPSFVTGSENTLLPRGPPCTLKSSLNGTLKDTLRACPGSFVLFPWGCSLPYRETMIGATSSSPRPCIPVKTRFLQLKKRKARTTEMRF